MTTGLDHGHPPMGRDCERLQTLLEELPEFERFDLDRFARHLESCPTCSARFPEVRALVGLDTVAAAAASSFSEWPPVFVAEVRAAPRPRKGAVPTQLRRSAATLAAAGILAACAAGLFRADGDIEGLAAPLHSQIDRDHEAPAVVSDPEAAPATRIDGTTRWTQLSYASGPTARSTLQTTISRPNRRIRATVTR